MRLAVITHTPHWREGNTHYAYGPYVREMNLWAKHSDAVTVVAPKGKTSKSKIHWPYERTDIDFNEVSGFSFVSFRESVNSFSKLPSIFIKVYRAMKKADHIHLRCPGNLGMIGCVVQVLFPNTPKTAKYAGNWDPQSKQPLSYRFQKWLLSNTFLTKNMKVLAYGEWDGQSNNVLPFFTASYSENKIVKVSKEFNGSWQFVFVGSLVSGKQPQYAIELLENLHTAGIQAELHIYGDGALRESLEKNTQPNVYIHGNQPAQVVEDAFKKAHFVVLPSKSEGWPKVIAEGMFYGAVPLVTPVSCVPWMVGNGERGLLITMNIKEDLVMIETLLSDRDRYEKMSFEAQEWSQKYTLEYFEASLKELLI